MSGPKVVRVVTLEEVLLICTRELAHVDAALAEWERVLSRCGSRLPAEVRTQRKRLGALMASGQYVEVQKEAPALIARVDSLLEELVNAQFSPEARAARGRAGLAASAPALIAECRSQGHVLAPELLARLGKGDSAAVAEVMALLSTSRSAAPLQTDTALLGRLRQGESRQYLGDWLAAQAEQDPRYINAEKQIALLRGLDVDAQIFTSRLEALVRQADAGQRGLLLDALYQELAAAVRTERQMAARRCEIAALQSQLAESVKFDKDLEKQLLDLQARHQAMVSARGIAAARESVLNGLRQLGYEVREGMSTAWESEGKLVLRHPSGDGYGVELGGRGEKLQVRAVGLRAQGSREADVSAEQRWCGELTELQAQLAKGGEQLEILKATPIGAQPVKRVVLTQEVERAEDEQEEFKMRRIGE